MSKPLKIYIAGPYTHKEKIRRETNVALAIDSAINIYKKGHFPYIPHLTHFVDMRAEELGIKIPWIKYMKWHDIWLDTCDAFLYLGSSKGADRELKKAEKLRIKIFHSVDDIPTFKKNINKSK